MAGDWIKVRCDLQTHPKVVRILSAIRRQDVQGVSDKFRVIGGLHAVWTVFDQHSTDGKLPGYTPEIMDHVIGFEGFSQAMIDVGWLSMEGKETLVMPEFTEHNGKSGKRRAEDQKRKRDARRESEDCPDGSGQDADKKRTRGEKSRSKKKKVKKKAAQKQTATRPDYLREEVWSDYKKFRANKKAPLNNTAWGPIEKELKAGIDAGHDPNDMIAEAMAAGWQGFKFDWYLTRIGEQGGSGKREQKPPHLRSLS